MPAGCWNICLTYRLAALNRLDIQSAQVSAFRSGPDDVTRELATATSAADMPHELRRQMYHEAHAFKHSPLFTQKVRLLFPGMSRLLLFSFIPYGSMLAVYSCMLSMRVLRKPPVLLALASRQRPMALKAPGSPLFGQRSLSKQS